MEKERQLRPDRRPPVLETGRGSGGRSKRAIKEEERLQRRLFEEEEPEVDGVEKPEDLAMLKEQRAKVQAAYKRLMAMEENPNIIKNNSLKARGDSIKNEKKGGAPSCAARSHATARFWVTGVLNRQMRRAGQKVGKEELSNEALQAAMADLLVGFAEHGSPHCALLLLRLMRLSRLQLFYTPLLMQRPELHFMAFMLAARLARDGDVKGGWKDPQNLVIDYHDSHSLFGDEIRGPTPARRRQLAKERVQQEARAFFRAFPDLASDLALTPPVNVPRNDARRWVDRMAEYVLQDPDLAPGFTERAVAYLQSRPRTAPKTLALLQSRQGGTEGAEAGRLRLVVVDGEVRFLIPGDLETPCKAAPTNLSQKEIDQLRALLVREICEGKKGKLWEEAKKLLTVERADLEADCREDQIREAGVFQARNRQVREVAERIKAGSSVNLPECRAVPEQLLGAVDDLDGLCGGALPMKNLLDQAVGQYGNEYPYPIPWKVSKEGEPGDLTGQPELWLDRYFRLREDSSVALHGYRPESMMQAVTISSNIAYCVPRDCELEETCASRSPGAILAALENVVEDTCTTSLKKEVDINASEAIKRDGDSVVCNLIVDGGTAVDRHESWRAEALHLAVKAAEGLLRGDNSPSDVQQLCRTIRACSRALECTCASLAGPEQSEEEEELLSTEPAAEVLEGEICDWRESKSSCLLSREWHQDLLALLTQERTAATPEEVGGQEAHQVVTQQVLRCLRVLARYQKLSKQVVHGMASYARACILARKERLQPSDREGTGVTLEGMTWEHLSLLDCCELANLQRLAKRLLTPHLQEIGAAEDSRMICDLATLLLEGEEPIDVFLPQDFLPSWSEPARQVESSSAPDGPNSAGEGEAGKELPAISQGPDGPAGQEQIANGVANQTADETQLVEQFVAALVDKVMTDHPDMADFYGPGVWAFDPVLQAELQVAADKVLAAGKFNHSTSKTWGKYLDLTEQWEAMELDVQVAYSRSHNGFHSGAQKLKSSCRALDLDLNTTLVTDDVFEVYERADIKQLGALARSGKPILAHMEKYMKDMERVQEHFLRRVQEIKEKVASMRCIAQAELDTATAAFGAKARSIVSLMTDSQSRQHYRLLGYCLKKKLLKKLAKQQEVERQQRERELVEGEEAAKPAPHPPASQAKAEKKRRQAAEKAARRRAEVAEAGRLGRNGASTTTSTSGQSEGGVTTSEELSADAPSAAGFAAAGGGPVRLDGEGEAASTLGRSDGSSLLPSHDPCTATQEGVNGLAEGQRESDGREAAEGAATTSSHGGGGTAPPEVASAEMRGGSEEAARPAEVVVEDGGSNDMASPSGRQRSGADSACSAANRMETGAAFAGKPCSDAHKGSARAVGEGEAGSGNGGGDAVGVASQNDARTKALPSDVENGGDRGSSGVASPLAGEGSVGGVASGGEASTPQHGRAGRVEPSGPATQAQDASGTTEPEEANGQKGGLHAMPNGKDQSSGPEAMSSLGPQPAPGSCSLSEGDLEPSKGSEALRAERAFTKPTRRARKGKVVGGGMQHGKVLAEESAPCSAERSPEEGKVGSASSGNGAASISDSGRNHAEAEAPFDSRKRAQASQHANDPGQSNRHPGSVPEAAPNGTRWGDIDEDSPEQRGSGDRPEDPEERQHEGEFQEGARRGSRKVSEPRQVPIPQDVRLNPGAGSWSSPHQPRQGQHDVRGRGRGGVHSSLPNLKGCLLCQRTGHNYYQCSMYDRNNAGMVRRMEELRDIAKQQYAAHKRNSPSGGQPTGVSWSPPSPRTAHPHPEPPPRCLMCNGQPHEVLWCPRVPQDISKEDLGRLEELLQKGDAQSIHTLLLDIRRPTARGAQPPTESRGSDQGPTPQDRHPSRDSQEPPPDARHSRERDWGPRGGEQPSQSHRGPLPPPPASDAGRSGFDEELDAGFPSAQPSQPHPFHEDNLANRQHAPMRHEAQPSHPMDYGYPAGPPQGDHRHHPSYPADHDQPQRWSQDEREPPPFQAAGYPSDHSSEQYGPRDYPHQPGDYPTDPSRGKFWSRDSHSHPASYPIHHSREDLGPHGRHPHPAHYPPDSRGMRFESREDPHPRFRQDPDHWRPEQPRQEWETGFQPPGYDHGRPWAEEQRFPHPRPPHPDHGGRGPPREERIWGDPEAAVAPPQQQWPSQAPKWQHNVRQEWPHDERRGWHGEERRDQEHVQQREVEWEGAAYPEAQPAHRDEGFGGQGYRGRDEGPSGPPGDGHWNVDHQGQGQGAWEPHAPHTPAPHMQQNWPPAPNWKSDLMRGGRPPPVSQAPVSLPRPTSSAAGHSPPSRTASGMMQGPVPLPKPLQKGAPSRIPPPARSSSSSLPTPVTLTPQARHDPEDMSGILSVLGMEDSAAEDEPPSTPVPGPTYRNMAASGVVAQGNSDESRHGSRGGQQLAVVGIATPGLQNNAGEYNCFLNCILQCLWNCTELRPAILSWQPPQVRGNAVVAALVELFRSFAAEESRVGSSGQRQIVSPAALRRALHSWNEARFRVGEMSDASEVLSAIYESLSMVGGGQRLVRELFQWQVQQKVECKTCNMVSHKTEHSQFFYHTSSTALRIEAAEDRERLGEGGGVASLGQLLARIEGQTLKTCDKDHDGCGTLLPVLNTLTPPAMPVRVFTLQLGWEKERENADDIRATMATITETVDVADIFVGGRPDYYIYRLNGMVCYYGLHYHAFVRDAHTGTWRMFDDATASQVGDWVAVQKKCQAGKIQPSVLFYQATWVEPPRHQHPHSPNGRPRK